MHRQSFDPLAYHQRAFHVPFLLAGFEFVVDADCFDYFVDGFVGFVDVLVCADSVKQKEKLLF